MTSGSAAVADPAVADPAVAAPDSAVPAGLGSAPAADPDSAAVVAGLVVAGLVVVVVAADPADRLDSDPDSSARVSVRARGYIEPHGQTDHS